MENVDCKILFITPPFTQLNTPYPATAYLKGFFNTQNITASQVDLGIDVTVRLFSKQGFQDIFKLIETQKTQLSDNSSRIFALHNEYIHTIDSVIQFLQGKNQTIAHSIVTRSYLPEASRFSQIEDLDWAFGELGLIDKAKHLATLYLEDMSDLIVEAIDPYFGFSRYAEKLALAATSFDDINAHLLEDNNLIDSYLLDELSKNLDHYKPESIAISVPFPGNLYGALKCGQWIKANYPNIPIIMGGGYPNTELRSISDARVFNFVDFICLDDGEAPLSILLQHLDGKRNVKSLKRTFALINNKVVYCNGAPEPDFTHREVGTPDYSGLKLDTYISVMEIANPMHRLWSDGRWNKLTLAHGCYWGKCTFCDISLDYIKRYEPVSAKILCDRIETIIQQTGDSGFHFVDEAAPPALLRDLSLEILRRNLKVTWWTNIRFEKSFTSDLTQLMKLAGCIAVSGGLEVASDRLLKKIKKGVSIEQVSKVNNHFTNSGIMVHAYLMYGFPTQTEQETIDSLEVVRQMFENNIIQSAYWHQFSMTAHSPVGLNPSEFSVERVDDIIGEFANNDLIHQDPSGADHVQFSAGLKKSLYNYMHGIGFDFNLQEWFDFKIPKVSIQKNLISKYITNSEFQSVNPKLKLVWTGNKNIKILTSVNQKKDYLTFRVENKFKTLELILPKAQTDFIKQLLLDVHVSNNQNVTYADVEQKFNELRLGYFLLFWNENAVYELRKNGLLVV